MPAEDPRLVRARDAKRESRGLDFKQEFDLNSKADWCEIVKDVVAMANSGGGVLVFGVQNNAKPVTGFQAAPLLDMDPATITDKVAAYTGEQFAGFHMANVNRGGRRTAVLLVDGVDVPIPFTRPGTYPDPHDAKRQKNAFSQGTVYVRHGAKSEPANRSDLRDMIDRRLAADRELLLRNVRRVVDAPFHSEVIPIRRGATDEQGEPTAIQLTTDPGAPVYGRLNPDRTHPHRQKELIATVNKRLGKKATINSHDVQSVRHSHDVNAVRTPEFAHLPAWGSQQYSDAFVDWLVANIKDDPGFLGKARQKYYDATHGR